MKIKLCGFTKKESLQVAIAEKCDFLGFVFCKKSPRYITPQDAAFLSSLVPSTIKKVAVIVDAPFSLLEEIVKNIQPNFFQFHGAENISYLQKVKETFPDVRIIKALKIKDVQDLDTVKDFENYVDFFLFDSSSGGSGKKFDWEILQNFSSKKDWFLAGGINLENVAQALQITNAPMVDISSGIEEIRGTKSVTLIKKFMQAARNLC